MGIARRSVKLFAALVLLCPQFACGPEDAAAPDPASSEQAGLSSSSSSTPVPAPNPPPASCDQRHAGVTGIQVQVRVDKYQGLIYGSNGTHEIAYGTIISTPWVYDSSIVDTSNVELAMNVKSTKDPSGLPKEIKLSVGQVVEVEGEYIPAATANAHDSKGPAAVIHYSHSPCGYVTISGTIYR